MKRIVTPIILGAALVFAGSAQAVRHQRLIASHTMTVGKNHPRAWRYTRAGLLAMTFTPCVYVNGDPLLISDLSNDARTVTLYGDGTVVRLNINRQTMFVDMSTVNDHERVRIELVPGGAVDC